MRRSIDGGLNWGPVITVASSDAPISNPNPVEVLQANHRRAILLHYETENNAPVGAGFNMQIWSEDEGLTWINQKNISSFFSYKLVGAMVGPSVGLQASGSACSVTVPPPDFSSRIIFNAHRNFNFIYYSDYFGRSFTTSEPVAGLDECSMAFSPEGSLDILLNCRTSLHKRGQIQYKLDTKSGNYSISSLSYPPGLTDPNCQGSIINHGGRLLLSNVNNTAARAGISIKCSKDQGATWSPGGPKRQRTAS